MNKRLRNYLIGIALVLVLPVIFNYALGAYWSHILVLVGIYGSLTLSLNLILGYTGQMNIGHLAIFGIGAYFSGILMTRFDVDFWTAMLAAGVLGVICAILLGYATFKRVRGVYLAMASFTLLFIVGTVATNWYSVTGGTQGLRGIPAPSIFGFTIYPADKMMWAYLVLPIMVLVLYIIDSLMRSRVGRALISIRDDEDLAESSGVNTFAYKMISLCIGCFIAGISGALYGSYMGVVSPSAVSFTAALTVCVAIAMGGIGSLIGPIVGTAAVMFVPEFMRPLGLHYYLFFIILVAVMAATVPTGIMGVIAKFQEKLKRMKTQSIKSSTDV